MRAAGDRLRVGQPVPQLERPLVLLQGLHVSRRPGPGRRQGPAERLRCVVRGGPVVGDLERRRARGQLGPRLQQCGESRMQTGVLAGQHVLVDHLAQQRVAEAVTLLVDGEDRGVDGLAQIGVELGRRPVADQLQQGVVDPVAGDGGHLNGLLRAVGESLDPDVQRVAQRVGHVDATARRRAGELGHEVGQALAAPVDEIGGDAARSAAEQLGQQVGHLTAAEPGDLQSHHAGQPTDLGQERAQRVAAVQLVGAVGGDHQHRGVGEGAGQEAQQVPGRLVGPVQVLDHHHQRTDRGSRPPTAGRPPRRAADEGSPARSAARSGRAGALRDRPGSRRPSRAPARLHGRRRDRAGHRRSARRGGLHRPGARTGRGSPGPVGRRTWWRARAGRRRRRSSCRTRRHHRRGPACCRRPGRCRAAHAAG